MMFAKLDRNLTEGRRVWLPEIMPIPDSPPWMESADAKIARAKEHLDALYAEASVFFESTKRHLQKTQRSVAHRRRIVKYTKRSPVPHRLRANRDSRCLGLSIGSRDLRY